MIKRKQNEIIKYQSSGKILDQTLVRRNIHTNKPVITPYEQWLKQRDQKRNVSEIAEKIKKESEQTKKTSEVYTDPKTKKTVVQSIGIQPTISPIDLAVGGVGALYSGGSKLLGGMQNMFNPLPTSFKGARNISRFKLNQPKQLGFFSPKGALQRYPRGPLTPEEITTFRNSHYFTDESNVLRNYAEESLNKAISGKNRDFVNQVLYGGKNWSASNYIIAGIAGSAYPSMAGIWSLAFSPPAVKNKVFTKTGISDPRDYGFLSSKDTTIDLTNRNLSYAKINEIKDGTVILGGEFIESMNNSVRKAKDWLNANDTYGDKKLPSKDVKSFYGVENDKFKVGTANEFDPNTEIVPMRFGNKNIKEAILRENGEMRLLDDGGLPIYQNTPNTGKFILYSPDTRQSEFNYINNGSVGVKKINDFLKRNKSAQYITLDNGRYEYYGVNPEGLTSSDFQSYYEQDLKRKNNPGYNLIIKKTGGIIKYQSGGKPTTQDSLQLLANSNDVRKYYSTRKTNLGNPVYKLIKASSLGPEVHELNLLALKLFMNRPQPNALTDKGPANVPISSYYQNIDKNKYKQRDMENGILDLRAPMTLFDRRIHPQLMQEYENKDRWDPIVEDRIHLATYPKLQITPINRLTRAERIERQKTYGVNPGETNYLEPQPKKTLTQTSKFVSTKSSNIKKPVITNDPKDPKLRAYNDSINLYRTGKAEWDKYKVDAFNVGFNSIPSDYDKLRPEHYGNNSDEYVKSLSGKIKGLGVMDSDWKDIVVYKKPTQPIVYQPTNISKLTPKGLPTTTPYTPQFLKQPDRIELDSTKHAAYKGIDVSHYTDALGRYTAKLNLVTKPGVRGRIGTFQMGGKTIELSGPTIRANVYPKGTIVTNDPNDPRLKAYRDSLIGYNLTKDIPKLIEKQIQEEHVLGQKFRTKGWEAYYNAMNPLAERHLKETEEQMNPVNDFVNRTGMKLSEKVKINDWKYKRHISGVAGQLPYTDPQKILSEINVYKKPVIPVIFSNRESAIPKMSLKGLSNSPTITPNPRIMPDVVYKDNNVPNAAYNKGMDITHFTDPLGREATRMNMSTTPGIRGRLSMPNPKGNYTISYQSGGKSPDPKKHPLYPNVQPYKNRTTTYNASPTVEPQIGRIHPIDITNPIKGINLSKTKTLDVNIPGGKQVLPLMLFDAGFNVISLLNDEKEIRRSKNPVEKRKEIEKNYGIIRNRLLNPDLYKNFSNKEI